MLHLRPKIQRSQSTRGLIQDNNKFTDEPNLQQKHEDVMRQQQHSQYQQEIQYYSNRNDNDIRQRYQADEDYSNKENINTLNELNMLHPEQQSIFEISQSMEQELMKQPPMKIKLNKIRFIQPLKENNSHNNINIDQNSIKNQYNTNILNLNTPSRQYSTRKGQHVSNQESGIFHSDLSSIIQRDNSNQNLHQNLIINMSEQKSNNISIEQDVRMISNLMSNHNDQPQGNMVIRNPILPPKIKQSNKVIGAHQERNKENINIGGIKNELSVKQQIAQKVQERCMKALESAKKSSKPPISIHSQIQSSSKKLMTQPCQSARQSMNNFRPLSTFDSGMKLTNEKDLSTPKGSQEQTQRKTENSIRKTLRDNSIGSSNHKSNYMENNFMSTCRLNFNPIDTETCNTARSNIVSNFEQQNQQEKVSTIQHLSQYLVNQDKRNSMMRESYSSSQESQSMLNSRSHRKKLRFNENIEIINVYFANIYKDDLLEESQDEIDRQFRKYFKVSSNAIVINDNNDADQTNQIIGSEHYDPMVCDMRESDIWRVVFANLNILYPRLWEFDIGQLDKILEKEFMQVRRTQIIDEDTHCMTIETVEELECMQRQNEQLQKDIQAIQEKQHSVKRLVKSDSSQKIRSPRQNPQAVNEENSKQKKNLTKVQSTQVLDEFEMMWQKLNDEKQELESKYQTNQAPLESSFLDQSSQQQKTLNESKKLVTQRDWEMKWNKIVREEKRKIDGDASFMDVNDSFTEQFDGLIKNFDESSINKLDTIPEFEFKSQDHKPQNIKSSLQIPQQKTLLNDQSKDQQYKYSDKNTQKVNEETPDSTTKKGSLTKNMKAFELQYAKYEEKLKQIEDELKDYNSKSSQIESSPSPQQQRNRRGHSSINKNYALDSPKHQQEQINLGNIHVRSPQMKYAAQEQETPQFNKIFTIQNKLNINN
ncbi:UNKNOWN [Stylonychia lemnae]|uniref:Uncharacterized protein n=1 Tax=Stylonychia lemnae TaxID=5949 RepID=A0A078BBG3_STYLE|nr:UNKNOWN [Stylonychia lemnae]|eukprot:CDW91739.1 UNKNOWN [Stylonychia lemnae]